MTEKGLTYLQIYSFIGFRNRIRERKETGENGILEYIKCRTLWKIYMTTESLNVEVVFEYKIQFM